MVRSVAFHTWKPRGLWYLLPRPPRTLQLLHRQSMELEVVEEEGREGDLVEGPGSGGTSAHPSLIARTAKFRRVVLATSGRHDLRSVIIDRARPMLPASVVPEDLIAQAQVNQNSKNHRLYYKERQRKNVNVNEAVNNLLS
ncbi:hypothetical protein PFISCL1PPCAC_5578 [Pristionchus fissidentatus]|uniref:E3 ubiquitin-protein ligase UBR5 ubiquitin-associated domain-containing protein n=1 Tax=Pristionchus fissidentatus TaxID=1538716 RepID=A0AAV5V3W6_9BILA|nr:hypothetical protein PFISCL1PPCAC_5578 [Pristionchus fissidentatus]